MSRSHVLVLALLPWVCLAFERDWIYSGSGQIDPWVYHGFFHRLPEYVSTLYTGTYYGSRLAWLVPGYLAYALFPPHVANLVLHVGLYYVATAAIYRTVGILADRDSALMAAILFGTSMQVLIAIGWDYVDGAVLTYFGVAFACFVSAARSASSFWYIFAAGAASAGMIHSNLAALLLVPAGPVSYWILRGRESLSRALSHAAIWLGGAAALTMILGVVNVWAGGPFLFFMASVDWARGNIGTQTFIPASLLAPPVLAHLTLPAIGAIIALGLIVLRRSVTAVAASVPIMLGWLALALYDSLANGGMLQTQYYVSWMLWPTFVVIGLAASPLRGIYGWSRALALAVAISIVNGSVSSRLGYGPDPSSREQFDLVQQTIRFVSGHVPLRQGRPLFWLEQGDQNPVMNSLASTHMFLYSLAGSDYPRLPSDASTAPRFGATITVGSAVIIVSFRPPDPGQVAQEFARFGFSIRITATEPIEAGRIRYVLTVVEVGQLPPGNQAYGKTPDRFAVCRPDEWPI